MAKTLRVQKTSATVGLAIRELRRDGFYHVAASPVWIGPTPDDLARIDAGRPLRESIASDRVRNIGDDLDEIVGGICFHDLEVQSQGNDDNDPRHLYGWEVCFSEIYRVDLRTATRMARTLTLIDKRLEALDQKFGRPATYGTYLLRVADAIGATRFVFPVDKRSQSYLNPQRITDLAQGAYNVDALIEAWVHQRAREREAREAQQATDDARREAAAVAPTAGGEA